MISRAGDERLFFLHDGFIAGEEVFDCLDLPKYKTKLLFQKLFPFLFYELFMHFFPTPLSFIISPLYNLLFWGHKNAVFFEHRKKSDESVKKKMLVNHACLGLWSVLSFEQQYHSANGTQDNPQWE